MINKSMYTIGEMSKIHNIPIKTLRYYDEIGLFKPLVVNQSNGYRYYSTEQFEQLDTINHLKFLGFPLKVIKKHLDSRDIQMFLKLLKKQREITEATILKLNLISNQFSNRIKEIEDCLKIDTIGEPFIKYLPQRNIIEINERIHSESELEIALKKLQKFMKEKSLLFIGKVGLTISKDNLAKRKYDEYNSVLILRETAMDVQKQVNYLCEGDYGCIYFPGNHSNSREYYNKLQYFIKNNNYEIIGDSIERTIINEYISNDKNLHITEIQIPLRIKQ